MHSLKKSWDWCKENWKYIVTFGIPVLISFIISLVRKNNALENKVEMKQKEQEIEKEVQDLGESLRQDAVDAHEATIEKVFEKHEEALERIAQEEQDTLESITDAESATEAIKSALKIETKWEISPPKYPDPKKSSKNRICPCGSGRKYLYCHAKQWKPE